MNFNTESDTAWYSYHMNTHSVSWTVHFNTCSTFSLIQLLRSTLKAILHNKHCDRRSLYAMHNTRCFFISLVGQVYPISSMFTHLHQLTPNKYYTQTTLTLLIDVYVYRKQHICSSSSAHS